MGSFNDGIDGQISLQRDIVLELFPDTCNLRPTKGSAITITGAGILDQTESGNRLWRGVEDIPCRFDLSRAFRPAAIQYQTAETNEFNLELPYDVTIDENDQVIIGDKRFEIRRLKAASQWDVTIEALIMVINVDVDDPV